MWTIGTLANGGSATLTLEGTLDAGQGGNTIVNITTAASGDQPDPNTFGDDLTEAVGANDLANLVTVKTLASGDSTPLEGDTVTFQIVVDNNGAALATNVSLTDLLPAGLTATANNGVASQGSYDPVTGIWTIGTIANGTIATLTLEGTVDVGEGGNTIVNTTTAASGDQPDPTTFGDDLNESVAVDDNANLVTVKTLSSGDSTPLEGDTVTFQIVVDNNGAAQATNVSLTDLLPAGLTATANNGVASQGSYDPATGIWTIGTIANSGSATLTLEGTVDVGEGGNTIINTTTAASGDQPDPNTFGDDLNESVAVDNNANLVTVKTLASGNSTPAEGDTVTFQIVVDNNGAAQATNVSLTDLLPAGLTATANNGVASQGSYDAVTGVWTIGTIANGSIATLTLEGTVDVGEGGNTINNITTAATGDQPDPTSIGDDLTESVAVDDNANLVTVKTLASGDATPDEGDTVTFQIVVDNNGAALATNVSLTDLLPAGLTATANNGVASQGSYDAVTGVWTIGTIANGGSATLTLEGTVDVGEGGNTILNTTTAASGDQPDPNTFGDDLDESVAVDDNANLVTVKTLASGDSTPLEGDTVTFQIEVDNNGSAQATNVSLTDLLPAGLTATANNGVASQGSYDAATGVWTIGTIANGSSATLTLEGTVNVGEGGNTIANITTAASGDQPDPNTLGDDLNESVQVVNNPPQLVISPPVPGELPGAAANEDVIIVPAVDGEPLTIDLDDHLIDPEGGELTIVFDSLPPGASFNSATNELTFIPTIDNNGDTVLPVTVTDAGGLEITPTITIQPVNPAPVASPETITTDQDTPVVVDLLANDSDPDNDAIFLQGDPVLLDPSSGSLDLIGGEWVFTPAADFVGEALINYTLEDADGQTATSTHTVVVAGVIFVSDPDPVTVDAPPGRDIERNEFKRNFYQSPFEIDLIILTAVENLAALNDTGERFADDSQTRPLAEAVEGSTGYSSGKGYRGTISVDPTDECGRFFIDTIVNDEMLSVIARSTIDPARSSGVTAFSATLANGEPLPQWVSIMADGEYVIDRSVDREFVTLELTAHRANAADLVRVVEIDTLTGEIREIGSSSGMDAGSSEQQSPDSISVETAEENSGQ